jgi:LysR family hydrogen peroxide-inducible transcriptional activator
VSVVRFPAPEPARTVGMVWRKTTPLTRQLLDIADVVQQSAERLRAKRCETPRPPDQPDRSGDMSAARQ